MLDAIRNGGLHAIEEEDAAEEDQDHGRRRSEKKQARSIAAACNCPAETVDHASHGIEAIKPAPACGHERRRVGDGRGEHPELDNEGDDVADVAIKSVERGKPEADAQSGEEREEKKTGQPESSKSGENAVSKTENGEDNEADGKVHEARKNGGDGKNEAGEIHLGNEALVFDHHVSGGRERVGEVGPGDQRSEVENGIREAVRGELSETAEEKSENEHVEDGLQDDPEDTDGGLLVADLNVSPDEEVEELAVGPDLAETKLEEAARRLNADRRGGERKGSRSR